MTEPEKPRSMNEASLVRAAVVTHVLSLLALILGILLWWPALILAAVFWVISHKCSRNLVQIRLWKDAQWITESSVIKYATDLDVSQFRRLVGLTDIGRIPLNITVKLENGYALQLPWDMFKQLYPSERVSYEVRKLAGKPQLRNASKN